MSAYTGNPPVSMAVAPRFGLPGYVFACCARRSPAACWLNRGYLCRLFDCQETAQLWLQGMAAATVRAQH